MTIEKYNETYVLRDDLLAGGTKSVFLGKILDPNKDSYVYASPVYGAMQIALAQYCGTIGKKAVIFSAKRTHPHENSLKAKAAGALVYQVPTGYLSNCQNKARLFASNNNGQYLEFGANYPIAIDAIANRMKEVISVLSFEPEEVYCAVGSGTLLKGIVKGTEEAKVIGVLVGADFKESFPERVQLLRHPLKFEQKTKAKAPFPSSPNYDLKAWEICQKIKPEGKKVLFWNVF